jgi:hypothetical protein
MSEAEAVQAAAEYLASLGDGDCSPPNDPCFARGRLVARAWLAERDSHAVTLAALKAMSAMWEAYIPPDNYDGHAAQAQRDAVAAILKATT